MYSSTGSIPDKFHSYIRKVGGDGVTSQTFFEKVVGIALNGVLIYNANSALGVDAIYPPRDTVAPDL